ncbi:MAG: Sodium/calcium exchanger protein-domain-containing protein [Benniella sp.]|nr:MAG: Sodium/calcium exchanger protein-domain-containing protein [Benniella sp.]
MALSARPFYLVLTLFLFTQIVTVLWPQHHFLASRRLSHPASWLTKRSLEPSAPDIQCEDVWSHPDRCAFVEEYCADYPAGLINYLHFYFCDLSQVPIMAIVTLCFWMIFLFGFVGVAASDFFCPNLSTIAKQLHLSESMTGVTFLAFGNGSPDVFSTFSAIGAGSGSLAIGELVGAASFITSVVVGSMAIITPFKVSRAPFLRDVSFFAGCVLFTLFAVRDGRITLLESILLILYYVFYVSFVVIGNWWHQRVKSERELEENARNLYDDDEDDGHLGEDSPLLDEEQALLTAAPSRRGSKPPNIVTQFMTGPYDAYEDEEHDDGGDVQDSISLQPPGTPAFKRRPSLISAIEFNDVVRSLTLSGSRGRIASYDPSYYGPKSPRSPRHHRHASIRTVSSNPALRTYGSQPISPISVGAASHDGYLTPRREGDRAALTASPVPVEDDQEYFDPHFEQALLRQSLILPDHHSPGNQHLGHIHQSPDQASFGPRGPLTITQKFSSFLSVIKPIYFPTLLDWDEKSAFVKFLAITSIPMVLVLTLTLPVVELCDEDEESTDGEDEDDPTRPKITIDNAKEQHSKYDGWSRTATTTQMVVAPVFIATVVTSAAQDGFIAVPVACALGLLMSFLVRRFSTEEQPPRFYGALCFMGFLVAITWIFLVANEVVGILQAFGMIFGVSESILGLTIFAMGNSLGDLVANITIARMGFPRMAFSACFGGPLLNMLLGVGISGTYTTLKTGTYIPLEVSPTLFVSLSGVLLTLCAAIIVVPRKGYMMTRGWGWFLLSVYTICTAVNVTIEITSGKGSSSS